MAVLLGGGTRQPWKKDAACSVSSKNQLSSFGILIGILATGVEPICDAQDAFYLVLLVSNKLDLLHVIFGASAQLKRR